jgi:hypothetical protein
MSDEDNQPATVLPPWTPEEKSLWLDLLEAYSTSLMAIEEDQVSIDRDGLKQEAKATAAVALGAKCADLALREFQYRQFSQQAPEHDGQTAEQQFEQFTAWLERSRASTKKRSKRRITRR